MIYKQYNIPLQYMYGLPLYLMTQALDVNMILRKAATVSTPVIQIINIIIAIFIVIIIINSYHQVMEITEAGGVWSIKTSTTLKSMDLKFKVYLYLYLSLNCICISTCTVYICICISV